MTILREVFPIDTHSEFNYNQVTVGTSAVQLSSSNIKVLKGILIKADDDNTGNIYVGDENVTTSNGFRLTASQAIVLEIDDVSKVYVIADTTNQKVYWLSV